MNLRNELSRSAAVTAVVTVLALAGCGGGAGSAAGKSGAMASARPTDACTGLADAVFINAQVTIAERIPAGPYEPPDGGSVFVAPIFDAPEFCRVAATLRPSLDSNIKMEVWLPTEWNGKFMMVGNGSWEGAIYYHAMSPVLSRGYAVASTDTGHQGNRGTFAFDHPEWLVDFAWRAVHETAVTSQAIIAAYYAAGPRHSYWNGCSSGGRQGLKEAQMFPFDFDGIIVGAPAGNWVRFSAAWITASVANQPLPSGEPILRGPEIELLHTAAIEQWVEDGVAPDQVPGQRLAPSGLFDPLPDPLPDLGARPICAYPDIAVYDGSGNDSDPGNFSCQAGARGPRPGHGP